jgi:hypothetical protein
MAARAPPELEDPLSLKPGEDATVRRAAPPGFIHLGVAKEIYSVLRDLGADPEGVIEEADLDPRLFEHADNLIPVSALGRLLLLCVERAARISDFSSDRNRRQSPYEPLARSCDARIHSAMLCGA